VTLQRMQELNTGSTAAILRDGADKHINEPPVSGEKKAIFCAAHFPYPSMLGRSSIPAPVEERQSLSDLADFRQEFDSAIDSIFQAYPKYIGFIL
jgi:hypothetical protein